MEVNTSGKKGGGGRELLSLSNESGWWEAGGFWSERTWVSLRSSLCSVLWKGSTTLSLSLSIYEM